MALSALRLGSGSTTLWCYLIYTTFLALNFVSDLVTRPIGTDEAFSYYQVSARGLFELLDSFGAGVNAIPYSYFLGLWSIDRIFGLGPATLRLPSLVFAVAAAFLFHRMLKARFGDPIAFVSCVSALLLSDRFILHSHEARPYSLYVLTAAFCLYACIKLIEEESDSWRALLVNAGAAFALPSVHYVGMFYGVSAAIALLYAQRYRGKPLFRTVASFVIGWLLFTAVHLSQIKLFAENKGLMDPTWIPRPSLGEVYHLALRFVTLPPVVCAALIAFVVLTTRATTTRAHPVLDTPTPLVKSFLFVVSVFWIVLPPAFYFLGSIGLPNLSDPRYFAPSQLATGSVAALLLALFSVDRAGSAWSEATQRRRTRVSVALAVVFLVYPMLAAINRTIRAPAYRAPASVWQRTVEQKCVQIERPMPPCVTNNAHVFFQYAFHRGEGPLLWFLRKSEAEVSGFKRFDSRLPVISATGLSRMGGFRFLYQKGSVNSFPAFDIHVWGQENGYKIVEAGTSGDVAVFDAKRF